MKTRFKWGLEHFPQLLIFIGLISKSRAQLSDQCEKAFDYDKDSFIAQGEKCMRDPPINFEQVIFQDVCVSLCLDSGGDPDETSDKKTLSFKSFFKHESEKAAASSDRTCAFDAFLPFKSGLSSSDPDPSRNQLTSPCDADPKFLSCMDNQEEWIKSVNEMLGHVKQKAADSTRKRRQIKTPESEKVYMLESLVSEIKEYPFKDKLTPEQLKDLQDGVNSLVETLKSAGVSADLLDLVDVNIGNTPSTKEASLLPVSPPDDVDSDPSSSSGSSGSDGSNLEKFQDMVDNLKDQFPDADPNLVSGAETTPESISETIIDEVSETEGGAGGEGEGGAEGGEDGTHPLAEGADALAQLRSLIDDIDDEIQKGKKPSKKHIQSLHKLVKQMRGQGLKIPKVMRKDLKLVLDHIRHHHGSDETSAKNASKKKKKHKKKKKSKKSHHHYRPRRPLPPAPSLGGDGGGSSTGGGTHPYEQKMLVEVKNPDQLKDFKVTFKGLDKGQSDNHDEDHVEQHKKRQEDSAESSDYSDYLEYLDSIDEYYT